MGLEKGRFRLSAPRSGGRSTMPDMEPSVLRQLARLSTIGIALVAATAIGLLIGYGLDRLLGTRPWLTMVFAVFGIAAGFLNLFRDVGLIERRWR
jgi:ATP synthase protein I